MIIIIVASPGAFISQGIADGKIARPLWYCASPNLGGSRARPMEAKPAENFTWQASRSGSAAQNKRFSQGNRTLGPKLVRKICRENASALWEPSRCIYKLRNTHRPKSPSATVPHQWETKQLVLTWSLGYEHFNTREVFLQGVDDPRMSTMHENPATVGKHYKGWKRHYSQGRVKVKNNKDLATQKYAKRRTSLPVWHMDFFSCNRGATNCQTSKCLFRMASVPWWWSAGRVGHMPAFGDTCGQCRRRNSFEVFTMSRDKNPLWSKFCSWKFFTCNHGRSQFHYATGRAYTELQTSRCQSQVRTE